MNQSLVAVSLRAAVGACLLATASACTIDLVDDSTGSPAAEMSPAPSAPTVTSSTQAEPDESVLATTTTDASPASTVALPVEQDSVEEDSVEEGSVEEDSPQVLLELDANEDALAGDEIGFGPSPGDRLVVVAVESDDVLNVRDEPMGTIVAMLQIIRGETDERLWVLRPDTSVAAYLEDDAVVATGRARSLSRSTWYEVTVGGYTGWASAAYLAYAATVQDVTEEVTRAAGGRPEAASMDELARIVLEALEPRIGGEPVTVSGPGWFEGLAEMEIDLVVRGSRHFGQRLSIAASANLDWDGTLEIIDARLGSATLQTLCMRGWNGERCL